MLYSILQKYIPKPIHTEEGKQYVVDHVYNTLLVALIISVSLILLSPLFLIFAPTFTLRNFFIVWLAPIIIIIGLYVTYRYLTKLEVNKALTILMCFVVVAFALAIFWSPDGIYDPGVFSIAMVMVMINYFSSISSLRFFTISITTVLLIEFFLEKSGIKVTNHPSPPFFHLLIYLLFIFGCHWFLRISIQHLKAQMVRLRDSRDELALYKDDLEQKVEERTAQLQVAKNRAEEANTTKSRFLASMSHELRTPLNAIIGYSEMIKEELDDVNASVDASEDVEKVRTAAVNLLALINNILDLSKVEANHEDFNIEKLSATDLVAELETMLLPIFSNNNNTFHINCFEPDLYVWGDQQKLRQILINLIGNANKFTERGKITLSVLCNDEEICFAVTDTGIGIKEEFLAKLFDPFSQAEDDYSRKYEGTGLGLSISKKFVEMMGGRISVESEFGTGTTFFVFLPRVLSLTQSDTSRWKFEELEAAN